MTVDAARLRTLLKAAPKSTVDLLALLHEGFEWPIYDTALEPDDVLIDWSPEELHLDSSEVARLAGISQIPRSRRDRSLARSTCGSKGVSCLSALCGASFNGL